MIALAPCFIGDFGDYYANISENAYRLLASALNIFGVESLFGPKWVDQVNLLCTLLGEDSEECMLLSSLELGPIHTDGKIGGIQEVGVKQSLHMAQKILEGRF